MVTISISAADNVIVESPVNDYRFRGVELEDFNVLDFFWDTYERSERQSANQGLEDAGPLEDVSHTNDTTSEDTRNKSHYLPMHPKYGKSVRVIRSPNHNAIPNFTGRFLPRNDDQDIHDLYCASILTLARPWRELLDLKAGWRSWDEEFEQFIPSCPKRLRDIIGNLQHYYRCGDATIKESRIISSGDVPDEGNEIIEDQEEMPLSQNLPYVDAPNPEIDVGELIRQAHMGRIPAAELLHGSMAIDIGRSVGLFDRFDSVWKPSASRVTVEGLERLHQWKKKMVHDANNLSANQAEENDSMEIEDADVQRTSDRVEPSVLMNSHIAEDVLPGLDPSYLLKDQRRAYDIITTHLDDWLKGNQPHQLRMVVHGEGGTGKSRVIQTVTDYFRSRGVEYMLMKTAYTGIAASLIGGRTIHSTGKISISGRPMSDSTKSAMAETWRNIAYLIIDEISMVSRALLAVYSRHIAIAKTGKLDSSAPFGGLNVIICGDFHQFPPVGTKSRSPLYFPNNTSLGDKTDDCMGRIIYEGFTTVVVLKEQVRVTDPVWLDFLRHLRNGRVQQRHITMLKKLTLTNPEVDMVDFSSPPWDDAHLVTPRHAVRIQWNAISVQKHCERNSVQLFHSFAEDSIHGRPLTDAERISVAKKKGDHHGSRQDGTKLPDEVSLAIGMKVMVTVNVETDLDITNGARGTITGIGLHLEENDVPNERVVQLSRIPVYILVKLDRTKLPALEGLDEGVIPITPIVKSFSIETGIENPKKKTVRRLQFPMTEAYAFTDYRSQGQTIPYVIVDIAKPPTGSLTLFNVYVALSRSSGRGTIRLLRDFDEEVLLKPLDEHLALEDDRLRRLDKETEVRWAASHR